MKNLDWFENLRALKATSNMSMREIAAKSGIPEPTLEKIFSGATKSPGVNTIQSLVHALGYTLDDIDSGPNKKSPSTAEAAPGEDVLKLLESLDGFLVSMGYIGADDDLTEQQQEVLIGICRILRATFEKK